MSNEPFYCDFKVINKALEKLLDQRYWYWNSDNYIVKYENQFLCYEDSLKGTIDLNKALIKGLNRQGDLLKRELLEYTNKTDNVVGDQYHE